jgi:ABC-type glycerol-3-phosphate transport system substrate-binding protein
VPPLQPTATTTVAPVANETAQPEANDQLVVWLPAFTGITTEGSAGALFNNVFHQFEQENPSINLDIQVKADVGTASLFNYLRSAQVVAPTILPDLVLINTQQLWQLVDLGMVVALHDDELFPDDNFYMAAREAVRYRQQVVGVPYALDIIHLAYDHEFVEQPPANWSELLTDKHPFLFPAAEAGTSNATLLQYVGAGGKLMDDGSISDPEALEAFFRFVAQAHEQEVIPAAVLDLPTFSASWREFADDHTNLAMVEVTQFYPNTTSVKSLRYAAAPTRNGVEVTVPNTWAFAVLTRDEQRRNLAFSLIHELLAPEVQGPWSQAVARLPSQPASLALWTQANDYRTFLEALLDKAVVPPHGPAFADFARRLHAAQAGILRGEMTVEQAIASMVAVE